MARRMTKKESDRIVSLATYLVLSLLFLGVVTVLFATGLLLPGLLAGAIGGILAERRRRKRIAAFWKDTIEIDTTPRRIRTLQAAGWFALSMMIAVVMWLAITALLRSFFPPDTPKDPPAPPAAVSTSTSSMPAMITSMPCHANWYYDNGPAKY